MTQSSGLQLDLWLSYSHSVRSYMNEWLQETIYVPSGFNKNVQWPKCINSWLFITVKLKYVCINIHAWHLGQGQFTASGCDVMLNYDRWEQQNGTEWGWPHQFGHTYAEVLTGWHHPLISHHLTLSRSCVHLDTKEAGWRWERRVSQHSMTSPLFNTADVWPLASFC